MSAFEPKIVYIAHPISGAVEKNIKLIIEICKKHLSSEIFPFAPYLAFLLFLNNESIKDYSIGIWMNKQFFKTKFIHELWLFGDRISDGMKEEIKWALKYKIPIIAKTTETKKALKQLMSTKKGAIKK